jgi:predicted DsbA family dithiol-disulfide isomerase
MAHQMALVSDKITADVVEATEYPHLAQRYNVMAVPKIVVNEKVEFTGALPEDRFLTEVLKAVGDKQADNGQ